MANDRSRRWLVGWRAKLRAQLRSLLGLGAWVGEALVWVPVGVGGELGGHRVRRGHSAGVITAGVPLRTRQVRNTSGDGRP